MCQPNARLVIYKHVHHIFLFGSGVGSLTEERDQSQGFDVAGVVGDNTFREGVVSGFLLILFSELGDKTFFIALLLALRQSQGLVFAGTFGALAVMTVISVRASKCITVTAYLSSLYLVPLHT